MSFILRTIIKNEKKGVTHAPLNRMIGDSYSLSTNTGKETEVWHKEIKTHYPNISLQNAKKVRAMVISSECMLVHEECLAYIMTNEGKTFEKI